MRTITWMKTHNQGQLRPYSPNYYANLCHNVLGRVGYTVSVIGLLADVYGGQAGILVVMTDFLCGLPLFQSNRQMWRNWIQALLTVVTTLLCIQKNMRFVLLLC